jgi:hypothetical protein
VPGELHRRLRREVKAPGDELYEHFLAHEPLFRVVRVEFFFLEIITIRAIEVTYRPDGFGHEVKRYAGIKRLGKHSEVH